MAIINIKKEEVINGPLSGLNFVITGALSVKRNDFEKEINNLGGKIQKSVNKKTDYLITDNPTTVTIKNEQADKLGIEKISEQQFYDRFNLISFEELYG
jgi:DNA ligase (NAD+)